jgi:WD40 repeat protein
MSSGACYMGRCSSSTAYSTLCLPMPPQEDVPVAAGSENNIVRLWDLTGQCKQVTSFRGCVWALPFLPSGIFLAGVSGSKTYVFPADKFRHAPTAMLQSFTASVGVSRCCFAREEGNWSAPSSCSQHCTALNFSFVFWRCSRRHPCHGMYA